MVHTAPESAGTQDEVNLIDRLNSTEENPVVKILPAFERYAGRPTLVSARIGTSRFGLSTLSPTFV